MEDAHPTSEVIERVAALLGESPRAWRSVHGGYTPAKRWVVETKAGTAFVKQATNPTTIKMLRRELTNYGVLKLPMMPHFIAGEDHPEAPLLIIEDLSRAFWPPPWSEENLAAVLEMIAALHGERAPIKTYAEVHEPRPSGWPNVAANPGPFLALGMVTPQWLDAALPTLLAAEAAFNPHGPAVTHWDIRSDNICILGGRAMLIDWTEACLSNPACDLGGFLPSLHEEGGPPPEAILPDAPEVAGWLAGYFASRAGLPLPDAPRVRDIQRRQLSTALPWAVRALGLAPI